MATQDFYAVKDAFIRQDTPTTNYNGATVAFGRQLNTYTYRAFVGFDLSAIPSGANITSAFLYIYRRALNPASGTTTFDVARVTGSWTETGVTWNNVPAVASAQATGLTCDNNSTTSAWRNWDVTTLVGSMLANSNDSIYIKGQNEGNVDQYISFPAKESSGCMLRITWETPAPSNPVLDSISTITTDSKTFNWSDSIDPVFSSSELYYEMQVSVNAGWSATQTSVQGVSQIPLNIKTFYSLEDGQYYYKSIAAIRVRAKTPLWNGTHYYSDWVQSNTFQIDYRLGVSAPSSLTPSDLTPYEGESITFECGRPTTYNTHDDDGLINNLTYYVELSSGTALANATEAVTSATKNVSYTVGNLTSGDDLSTNVRARAIDTEGQTSPYTADVAITFKRYRQPIVNVSSIDRAETSITVNFIIDDTGFGGTQSNTQIKKVQYNLNSAGWVDALLGSWTGLTNSFDVTGLTASSKGTIEVRAINNEPVVGLGDKTSETDNATVTEFIPVFAVLYDSGDGQGVVFARSLLIDDESASGAVGAGCLSVKNNVSLGGDLIINSDTVTAYVVANGSNSNGEYRKWSDNTMECWHRIALSSETINTALGGGYYNTTGKTWTFPEEFADTTIMIQSTTSGNRIAMSNGTVASTTQATIFLFSIYSITGYNGHINLYAKGTWE